MNTQPELKNCPFCGCAIVEIVPNGMGDFFAICGNEDEGCGARSSQMRCESREHAAERWNTRHAPEPNERLVRAADVLKRLLSIYTPSRRQDFHEAHCQALRYSCNWTDCNCSTHATYREALALSDDLRAALSETQTEKEGV